MNKEISELISLQGNLESKLEQSGDQMVCDIRLSKGDWGGEHVIVSMSPWSAAHIARQLIQLIERDIPGAHFDIDKASIAAETKHQLCMALSK